VRVVLDTNVVASAMVSAGGPPAQLFHLWRQEVFDVLVSEPILAEYRRVLHYDRIRRRHGLSDQQIDELIDDFRRFGDLVHVTASIAAITADPDDDMFIECAASGEADYIISGDSHLLDLRRYQHIEILSPSVFLLLLEHT
jgi:uncharacterized protein